MADWATISSLATAGGTMALAAATFASTRSANQAARVAERSMQARMRPLLLSSRPQDKTEKVMWMDLYAVRLPGGRAVLDEVDGVIYLAAGLRNAGSGVAVLHGWHLNAGWDGTSAHAEPDRFRRLTRDLYIPPGDTGFCQGAVREADDPDRADLASGIARRDRMTLEILYGDHDGGQRTITRLGLTPIEDGWICSTSRHWNLDRRDPR